MNNAQTNVIKWVHQYWGSEYRLQPSIKIEHIEAGSTGYQNHEPG